MHFMRAGLLILCLVPGLSFAQKREYVELQRDVAALQDELRTLERNTNENNGRMTALLQQAIDSISKLNTNVAVLDAAMRDREKTIAAPVTTVGAKVDQMSSDLQALRVSMDDLNSRLGKLQQGLVDLNNTIKVIQAPPSLPPTGGAGSSGPAAGNAPSAESLYANAMGDKTSGKDDIALQEFNDYIKFYGNTDTAPNAQYYIGEIFYNHKDYDNALKAFDMVLERYPENNKTLDAMYMKGRTLVLMGERTKGAEEFRAVYKKAPRSELAAKAKAQLASMGLTVNLPAKRSASSRRTN